MFPSNFKSNADRSSQYSNSHNVHLSIVKKNHNGHKAVSIPSLKNSEQESELDHIAVLGYD